MFLVIVIMDVRNGRDWLNWLGVVLGGCGMLSGSMGCAATIPFMLFMG
jgi:hypothetical protein